MTLYLQQQWDALTAGLPAQKQSFRNELEYLYTGKERYYHTLTHIEALHRITDMYAHLLASPQTIRWAIWYHDAIYDATKRNNEEKSAALALKYMEALGCNEEIIDTVYQLILATKTHELPVGLNSFDAQFFLDIDLLILGAVPEKYKDYTLQVRKEYSIYPDLLYKPGRKKVLKHFLAEKRIYKTDLLHELYERQARENMEIELTELR